MDQIDPLGEATGRLFAGLALDARRLSSSRRPRRARHGARERWRAAVGAGPGQQTATVAELTQAQTALRATAQLARTSLLDLLDV